jgi:phosphate starvation-inducible membrane PsiE
MILNFKLYYTQHYIAVKVKATTQYFPPIIQLRSGEQSSLWIVAVVVAKFPMFYRSQMFVTVITTGHHLSLSWAWWMQLFLSQKNFWPFYILTISRPSISSLFPVFCSQHLVRAYHLTLLKNIVRHFLHSDLIAVTILGQQCKFHAAVKWCLPIQWTALY